MVVVENEDEASRLQPNSLTQQVTERPRTYRHQVKYNGSY